MKGLRWNPFAMWSDHCRLVERVAKAEAEARALARLSEMTNDRISRLDSKVEALAALSEMTNDRISKNTDGKL